MITQFRPTSAERFSSELDLWLRDNNAGAVERDFAEALAFNLQDFFNSLQDQIEELEDVVSAYKNQEGEDE